MGVEPTHLLGVLQREASHTRLTEASSPNKGVRKAVQAIRRSYYNNKAIRSHAPTAESLHPQSNATPSKSAAAQGPLPPHGPNPPSPLSLLSVQQLPLHLPMQTPPPTPTGPSAHPAITGCDCCPRGSRQGSNCFRPLVVADPAAAATPGAGGAVAARRRGHAAAATAAAKSPHCLRCYQPDPTSRRTAPTEAPHWPPPPGHTDPPPLVPVPLPIFIP